MTDVEAIPDAVATQALEMEAGGIDPRWKINGWTGEFRDPDRERAYLEKNQHAIARQMTVALAVWAALVLVFLLADLESLIDSAGFWVSTVIRLSMVAALVFFAWKIKRRPMLATQARWISALEVIGMTAFLAVYLFRPEVSHWAFTLTLIMLVTTFVYIPNRIPAILAVTSYMGVSTVVILYHVDSLVPSQLVSISIVTLMPIGLGWGTAARTQVLQRTQFALWQQAQEVNARLSREVEQRSRLQAELVHQATTDALTGLNNRRQYESLFQHELNRSLRTGQPLTLCIIDLDHFKQINDTWGHAVGDEVLKRVGQLCRDSFRATDILGRLGGEEFVALLPETDLPSALMVAQRFVDKLAAITVSEEVPQLRVTATVGVAQRDNENHLDPLLQRADKALYAGKNAGRNQVVTG
ncbi:GGDEF domain-containing protein [Pseudomonas saliphila]|uniref:GGDEF domain-containing protein n=1 Tax=Pseudomonas saliphila TaxID=2586906 RepID=UPI00123B5117|nr:GGDEF domain-containing protein [Pseudomonas saliphila]